MKQALNGQNAFFNSLGGGANRLIVHFHQTRPPLACDPQVAGLQTVADIAAFIDRGGAAALKDYNLSALPDESLPIRLSDPASPYPSATAVGLAMDEYLSARSQPLPLGGLDTADIALRDTQAAWIAEFEAELTRLTEEVYSRTRRAQRTVLAIAVATTAAAMLPILATAAIGALPAAALSVATGLPGAIAAAGLVKLGEHRRQLALVQFRTHVRERNTDIEALTRRRQDNLVALIDGLFAEAGHLRDDSRDDDLAARTHGRVRMIFALRTLLSGNRKCTRYFVRMLELVRHARTLQLRDQNLTQRRNHGGGYITQSYPHLSGRLWCLGLLGSPAVLSAVALAVTTASFAALAAALTGIAALCLAGWTMAGLNARIEALLSAADLAGLCNETAFDTMPGPADVPLEAGFLRLIDRWLGRLIREENKHH